MKVATRLTGAFALLAAFLIGLLVYHVGTIRTAVSTSYELSEISARLALSSSRLPALLARLDESASKYWITRDAGYREQFDEAFHAFGEALERLDAPTLGAGERDQLDRLVAIWADFIPVAESVAAVPDALAPWSGEALRLAVHEHLDKLQAQTRLVAQAAQERMDDRLEHSATKARHAERITWGAVVGALLVGILISGLVVRSISDALRRLQEGTRQVAGGNFEYRLEEDRDDEFAELARDFNTMTRRLGELDRMKRDFLSKVSHDLKTPLASMQETTQLLLDEIPGALTETQQRLLRLNHQSGERLSAMIAKILDLSAMDAGAVGLEIGQHDVAALVRSAVVATTAASMERSIRVTARLPDPSPQAMCDGDLVVQVLVNLLENAIKFSPAGGTVDIAARLLTERPDDVPESCWAATTREDDGNALLVTVADDGPGVPESERSSIFERFYQTAAGRKVEGRGVGLGLAICREIVDAHGGAIWVGPAPGGGSIFSLLLPRALPQSRPAQARPATVS